MGEKDPSSCGAGVAQPSPAAGSSTVPVRVLFGVHRLAARRRPNPQAGTPALRSKGRRSQTAATAKPEPKKSNLIKVNLT